MPDRNDASNVISADLTDGELVDKIEGLLKGVSNNRAQNILKMVGAVHNIRFVPAFAPLSGPNTLPPARETRGQKGARVQPQADPQVKLIRSKINELNSEISKKSRELGGLKLPDNDPLLIRRGHLFRAVKNAQNKDSQALKEALEKEAEGASQSDSPGDSQESPSPSF